jgi:hypothetical protein
MELFSNPLVKMTLTLLAVANAAVLVAPITPPTVKMICGILAAVFTALGIGSNVQVSRELKGARAETLALQQKVKP